MNCNLHTWIYIYIKLYVLGIMNIILCSYAFFMQIYIYMLFFTSMKYIFMLLSKSLYFFRKNIGKTLVRT